MKNLDRVLESRDITLPAKVHIVKARYRCESWTTKKAEQRRADAFKLWCCRGLLRVPWTTRRSIQSFLKEINPEYSLEGLMMNLKLWTPGTKSCFIGKDPDAGKDWRQEEKGTTEDEMVGWHHQLNGYEFEQVPGDGEGQGSPASCSPWSCKESDTTERLNNNISMTEEARIYNREKIVSSISGAGRTWQLHVKEWNQNIL